MSRSGPSRADVVLIDVLAREGLHVSPYQLERWRATGCIPRNQRRGLGRGRGSASVVPEEVLALARSLAAGSRQGRRNPAAEPLVRFAVGFRGGVSDTQVRELYGAELDRLAASMAVDAGTGEHGADARADAAENLARRISVLPDWRMIVDLGRGEEWHDRPPRDARFVAQVLTQVAAGGVHEVSEEDLLRATSIMWGLTDEQIDGLVDELRKHQLAGKPSIVAGIPAPTVATMRKLASTAPIEDLHRAARGVYLAFAVGLAAMGDVITGGGPLSPLIEDPVWSFHFRFSGLPRNGKRWRALLVLESLAALARGPAWLAAIEQFPVRAEQLLLEAGVGRPET